jgi:hypothetical protein
VLELFAKGPVTTGEVGNMFTGSACAIARKAPSELVHFGLLEADGTRGAQTVYRITPLGEAFLRGPPRCRIGSGRRGRNCPRSACPARRSTSTKSPTTTPRATGQGTVEGAVPY